MERRLAAILAADVVGYSRLMGEDEAGALAALKTHRKEIVDPRIAAHGGRVVKLMGDGMLVEFPSVVEAMQCAVEIQRAMAERNAAVPEDRRVEFRIGINLGDVIVDGDDIHGDGVNVAARLEALAEPGGICIRRAVRNQVRDKLPYTYEDLGEIEVKNIARPVRVFQVVIDEADTAPAAAARTRKPWMWPAIAAAVVVVMAGAVALWLEPWAPRVEPASLEQMAFPLPDKPSIAVLPFDNMSGDPDQDYVADGFTENIITALSRNKAMFVIARNSTFTYKGKAVKVKQVAEDLGVRYVLEGSVQRSGDKVRVTAQLIDATGGSHVWAERYDRAWDDIFAVQDEIARSIAATLSGYKGTLQQAEYERALRKSPDTLTAHDYVIRGIVHKDRFTREDNLIAIEMFEKAIALAPDFALGYAWLSWAQVIEVFMGWSETPEETVGLAFELAQKAISLDPSLDVARWALGGAYLTALDSAQSLVAMERALELNPNNADILADTVWPLAYLGRADEGIANVERAMRLNPYYPEWYLWGLGSGQYFAKRYADAIATFNRMTHHNFYSRTLLAASFAQIGEAERAPAEVAAALKLDPDASLTGLAAWRPLFAKQEDFDHYVDGLRKAGLPE